MKRRGIALFDLDGTLADDTHRAQLAVDGDWTAYFAPERVLADPVLEQGRQLAYRYRKAGYVIAYLTARRHVIRDVTEDWIDANSLPMGRLYMKEWEETRNAAEYKAEVVQRLVSQGIYQDVVLFDDHEGVIERVKQIPGARAEHCTYYVRNQGLAPSA